MTPYKSGYLDLFIGLVGLFGGTKEYTALSRQDLSTIIPVFHIT